MPSSGCSASSRCPVTTSRRKSRRASAIFGRKVTGRSIPSWTLIAEKLVTKSVESEAGKPDRHVYSLTAKGRKELRRWLLKAFAPKIQRDEFLLKLFFGEEIPPKANIAHVEQFRELQRGLLQKYRAVEKEIMREYADNSNAPYWLMTVRYGQHVSRALLQWSDKTLAELNRMAKSRRRK